MEISGSNITMINEDSETITVSCVDVSGDPSAFVEGDTVRFTVKKFTSDAAPTIEKTVTEFVDGVAIIELIPSDTIGLSGCYTYDVQLDRVDGTVTTIIKPATLTIQRGVTT